ADVVLGNQAAESFYEARGFVPGETMQVVLFGERLIERRWWLAVGVEPSSPDRHRTAGSLG
ncbi:MAG: hypothetical protein RI637_07565, partial [Acidimicrobiia bacterium]|nr:hypothetical protein [Acidimicrobiia bacterium]